MVTKQRGLGRGLDALFDDEEPGPAKADTTASAGLGTAPAQPSDPSRKLVNVSQIDPHPDQPRRHFDEDALNALAASIKKHGLLQPILVRPNRSEAGRYEIIAGERRWRASQRAQLHEVPIIVRDLDDDQTFQIALIENLQREDLNPMEEAKGYQRLSDEFGYHPEQIAEMIGKSRPHVLNMTRLLQLPPSVQSMVTSGELSAGHARALLNASNPALLAQDIVSKNLSVRQAEALAKNNAGASFRDRGKKRRILSPDHAAVEKTIQDALGVHAELVMRGERAGVLKIEFATLDQFDMILARLTRAEGALENRFFGEE